MNSRVLELRAMPALMEKRNALLDEMDGIVNGAQEEIRAMSEEEAARFGKIKNEIEKIDATLKADEERRAMEVFQGAPAEFHAGEKQEETRAADESSFIKFIRGEETRALDVSQNGSIIPATIANRIIEKVKELSPIYSMVTVFNVGGDLVFPVYDTENSNVNAAYVDDMQELTEGSGKFTTVKLENFIVGTLSKVSKSLMNRTDFDLVGFTVNKVAEAISEFLEKELLVGTAGKMEGVLSSKNIVTAAAADKISADELIDLQDTLPDVYQAGACWIMSKDTRRKVRKLKDSEGNYLLNRDISTPFGYMLLGKPVYISESCPIMAAGKTAVAYGDMSGLYVKLAQNVEIQVLMEKYATQHAVGVVGYIECDSKIVEPQKLAVLKMAGSAPAGG